MISAKRPTIAELDAILNQPGNPEIEVLPTGEVRVAGTPRYNAVQEAYIDHSHAVRRKDFYTGKYKRSWLHCALIRLFPRHFAGFAKSLLSNAHERNLLDSYNFHEMMAMVERMVEPKIINLHVPGGHQ